MLFAYFIVLYAPFLGSSGLDIDEKLIRAEVYYEVKTQLMCDGLRKKDRGTVLPFIPEESYYRVAVICDGNLIILYCCPHYSIMLHYQLHIMHKQVKGGFSKLIDMANTQSVIILKVSW